MNDPATQLRLEEMVTYARSALRIVGETHPAAIAADAELKRILNEGSTHG